MIGVRSGGACSGVCIGERAFFRPGCRQCDVLAVLSRPVLQAVVFESLGDCRLIRDLGAWAAQTGIDHELCEQIQEFRGATLPHLPEDPAQAFFSHLPVERDQVAAFRGGAHDNPPTVFRVHRAGRPAFFLQRRENR